MKIGIISDSSSCLEYAPFSHNIKIARTSICFGCEEFIDGESISADEFYNRLMTTDIFPTTSAPTIGRIVDKINDLKNEGCTDIMYFPISFNLSDYGKNLSSVLKDIISDVNIYVVNTKLACLMEGMVAKYAEVLADKGYNIESIINEIDKLINSTTTYFVVDDLNYLVKNGRLKKSSAFIGSLIKIKPVLSITKDGKIEMFEKVRTYNKAIDKVLSLLQCDNDNTVFLILHSCEKEKAKEVKDKLLNRVSSNCKILTSIITPTVGAHIGCGVIGIAAINLNDLIKI